MTTSPDTRRRPSAAALARHAAEVEASLEAYFRETVRRRLGGMVVKLAPTIKGIPDRMVLLPGGRIILVELKTTTGALSAIQLHRHDRLAELGTVVVTLAGRAEVDRWVDKQFPSMSQIAADHKAGKSPRGVAPAKVLGRAERVDAGTTRR